MMNWKLAKLGSDQHLHVYSISIPDQMATEAQTAEIDGMTRVITAMRPVRVEGHILMPVSFSSTYCGMTGKWTYFASFRQISAEEVQQPLRDLVPLAA